MANQQHIKSIVLYERARQKAQINPGISRALLAGIIYEKFTSGNLQKAFCMIPSQARSIIDAAREAKLIDRAGLAELPKRNYGGRRQKLYALTEEGRETAIRLIKGL